MLTQRRPGFNQATHGTCVAPHNTHGSRQHDPQLTQITQMSAQPQLQTPHKPLQSHIQSAPHFLSAPIYFLLQHCFYYDICLFIASSSPPSAFNPHCSHLQACTFAVECLAHLFPCMCDPHCTPTALTCWPAPSLRKRTRAPTAPPRPPPPPPPLPLSAPVLLLLPAFAPAPLPLPLPLPLTLPPWSDPDPDTWSGPRGLH